jgi:hypothetical protein
VQTEALLLCLLYIGLHLIFLRAFGQVAQTVYERKAAMPAHRAKLIVVSLLLLSILACVNSGGIEPDTSARIRMLSVLFDESQRKEFFDRLEKFANSHDFEFEIIMMDPDLLPYSAVLSRDDNKIDVLVEELTLDFDVSPRPTMIYFRGGDVEAPVEEEMRREVDALVSDLLDGIGDIPTIRISDVSCKERDDPNWRRCISSALP